MIEHAAHVLLIYDLGTFHPIDFDSISRLIAAIRLYYLSGDVLGTS